MTKSTGVGRGSNPNSWKKRNSGDKHYRWNHGKIISSHGYVRVRVGKNHPISDPNGYAYEHALVWFNSGRAMPVDGEVLHHKNHNKQDNRLENLQLLTKVEHANEHRKMLSDADVREIRIRYAAGENATDLSVAFSVRFQTVYKWIHGKSRRLAGGPIQTENLRNNANRVRVDKKASGENHA